MPSNSMVRMVFHPGIAKMQQYGHRSTEMEKLNSMANCCIQWMLSCILKCKNQPDSYMHIIRIFWQNVLLQKNALLREHNFLQKYFGFHEAFFLKGPLFQKEEFTVFICLCSPLWVGKGLSSSQVQALSDSQQDCKSVVRFPDNRCSNS